MSVLEAWGRGCDACNFDAVESKHKNGESQECLEIQV